MSDNKDGVSSQAGQGFLDCVVLLVDGSEAGERAARFAVQLAQKIGCRVLAVYPVNTASMDYLLQMHIFVSEEKEDFEKAIEQKGEGYLRRIRALGEINGIAVETSLVRGRLHEAIMKHATRNHAKAILLGNWRTGRKSKDLSSAERELILELAEQPVFVIR